MNASQPRAPRPRAQRAGTKRADAAGRAEPPGAASAAEAVPTAQAPATGQAAAAPPAPPSVEVELKFAISPEHGARLGSLPVVQAAVHRRALTRTLHSIYYDTPDFALRREGCALRLRKTGGRWVQTVKRAGTAEAGLEQREEFETPLPAQVLNFPALVASGASAVFNDAQTRRALRPVFVTDFKRTSRDLALPSGAVIELAYDRGGITAGDAGAGVSEIELELKAGDPLELLEFAHQLAEAMPLRLEPRSKAQRGYELAADVRPAPVKAVTPALSPEMSVTDAFRAVVLGCIAQLQANEQGVLDGADYEYLHQARVAVRRLRSALSVFSRAFPKPAFLRQVGELRWLSGYLGPARDWDVLTLEALPEIAAALPGESGLHVLLERAARLRADADRAARDALASSRYTIALLQFVSALHRQPWLALEDEQAAAMRSRPLPEFAQGVLSRRHKRVRKAGRGHAELDAAGLHLLRIEIKKLRYAAEFFSRLWERKAVRDYTAALAALQELLGSLNDATTAERLCEALRDPAGGPDGAEALGLVRGWAAGTARAQLARLPEVWDAFRDTACFWE
jgi:inorganic triphosphatase YgiF